MSVASLLIQTASIERWTRTRDSSSFEYVDDWSSEDSLVPCNVQEKGAAISATVAGRNIVFDAVGYFLLGTDLKPQSDERAAGDRVTVAGATYQVRAVVDQTGRQKFLKAYLKRE